jgi:hypothetical protein
VSHHVCEDPDDQEVKHYVDDDDFPKGHFGVPSSVARVSICPQDSAIGSTREEDLVPLA